MEGIHHAFDDNKVLHGISLEVKPGQVASLLGPSGCGKSTLLRLAAGLEGIQQGVVSIDDQLVASSDRGLNIPTERRQIGMVFQDYALFPHLTVMDNILFGVRENKAAQAAWAREALSKTGLAQLADRFPHSLSGGQQQRVALLRALAAKPRVLLMDEPFSGLDVTLRARVREETLDTLREAHVATLMVTHDPEEAMVLSDTILVMNEGRIVQAGDPGSIYWNPADDFVASLFGPVNRLPGTVRDGKVHTPLGDYAADGLEEGQAAVVLARPSALQLSPLDQNNPESGGYSAVLEAYHLLGQATDVRLQMPETGLKLRAWVPGNCRTEPGSRVGITMNAAKVFVFADRD